MSDLRGLTFRPNCVQAGPEQAVLYAHVYALLYAGVVAAAVHVLHMYRARRAGRSRSRTNGTRARTREGRSRSRAPAYKRYNARIPGHGMEPAVRDPYTCDWTKLGLELDYEG